MSIELLTKRRSIRKYQTRQITSAELDQILLAGTYAPTGMNRQSPVMVAVQDPEVIRKMEIENARVMGDENLRPFYGAPTVIVVFADSSCPTGFEDACLVMGNLMNAACALGVDSIWVNRARQTFDDETGKAMLASRGITGDYEGIGICCLGYRLHDLPPAAPRKEGYIIRL